MLSVECTVREVHESVRENAKAEPHSFAALFLARTRRESQAILDISDSQIVLTLKLNLFKSKKCFQSIKCFQFLEYS